MQIIRHFDEGDFLLYLNRLQTLYFRSKDKPPEMSDSEYAQIPMVFNSILRSLVDEYLDSGRNRTGLEEPRKRQQGRKTVMSLFKFDQKHPISISRRPDGEREIICPPSARMLDQDGRLDPHATARFEARRLFSEFLEESDFKARFFKCRKCKLYFRSERKLAAKYRQGTYCQKCRHQVSAKASQERWRRNVLSLCAELLPRWDAGAKLPQNEWVAREVCAQLEKVNPGGKQIKKNWVTGNMSDIVAFAQGVKKQ